MSNVKIVDIPFEEVGNGIIWNIHEDVLEEEHWKHLHDFINNDWFSWTYQSGTTYNDGTGEHVSEGDTPQFVRHFFYRETISNKTKFPTGFNQSIQIHEYFEMLPQIAMIVQKLLPNFNPLRIKANLLQPHPDAGEHHPWHVDSSNSHTSMIYYINDSDGDTFINKTKTQRITPKANTAVIFPSNLWHASSNPTKGRRMVINYMVGN